MKSKEEKKAKDGCGKTSPSVGAIEKVDDWDEKGEVVDAPETSEGITNDGLADYFMAEFLRGDGEGDGDDEPSLGRGVTLDKEQSPGGEDYSVGRWVAFPNARMTGKVRQIVDHAPSDCGCMSYWLTSPELDTGHRFKTVGMKLNGHKSFGTKEEAEKYLQEAEGEIRKKILQVVTKDALTNDNIFDPEAFDQNSFEWGAIYWINKVREEVSGMESGYVIPDEQFIEMLRPLRKAARVYAEAHGKGKKWVKNTVLSVPKAFANAFDVLSDGEGVSKEHFLKVLTVEGVCALAAGDIDSVHELENYYYRKGIYSPKGGYKVGDFVVVLDEQNESNAVRRVIAIYSGEDENADDPTLVFWNKKMSGVMERKASLCSKPFPNSGEAHAWLSEQNGGGNEDTKDRTASDRLDAILESVVLDADPEKSDPDFWAKHDRAKHHGHFDPETMTCKLREKCAAGEKLANLRDEMDDIDPGDVPEGADNPDRQKVIQEMMKVALLTPHDKRFIAPNGEDTNLSEIQWLLVRTPTFKKWFGDWEYDPEHASKALDKNGEPLVLYHGTELSADFTDEDNTEFKERLFTTTSRSTARSYTPMNGDATVAPWKVYKNPYDEKTSKELIQEAIKDAILEPRLEIKFTLGDENLYTVESNGDSKSRKDSIAFANKVLEGLGAPISDELWENDYYIAEAIYEIQEKIKERGKGADKIQEIKLKREYWDDSGVGAEYNWTTGQVEVPEPIRYSTLKALYKGELERIRIYYDEKWRSFSKGKPPREKSGAIYEFFMNIRNPMVVDAEERLYGDLEFEGEKISDPVYIADIAQGRGYDGLILKNVSDTADAHPFEDIADDYVTFDAAKNARFANYGMGFLGQLTKNEADDIDDKLTQILDKSEEYFKLMEQKYPDVDPKELLSRISTMTDIESIKSEFKNKVQGGNVVSEDSMPDQDAAGFWAKHDKARHHGHFDPETMTCKLREKFEQGEKIENLRDEMDDIGGEAPDVGASGNASSGNVTPEEDAAYLEAVQRGDMETAAKMVREVASRKGFTEEVWHYGDLGRSDSDDDYYDPKFPFHVGTRQAALDRLYNRADSGAYEWAGYKIKNQNGKWYWQFKSEYYPTEEEAEKDMSSGGPYDSKEEAEDAIAKDFGGVLTKLYLDPRGMEISEEDDPNSSAPLVKYRNAEEDKGSYSYKIYEAGRIKSADPVTYGGNGNVIPLSRRFDSGNDIRGDVGSAGKGDLTSDPENDIISHILKAEKERRNGRPAQLHQRVPEEALRGEDEDTRILREASLICRAVEGAGSAGEGDSGSGDRGRERNPKSTVSGVEQARETSRRQEAILEKYARKMGIWEDDAATALKESDDYDYIEGGESIAFFPDDTSKPITKVITSAYFPETAQLLDRIILHNYLFPSSKLEVKGFGRARPDWLQDGDPMFCVKVEQQQVDTSCPAKPEQIAEHMKNLGFHKHKELASGDIVWESNDGKYVVSDLTDENAFIDQDGTIEIIDANIQLNTLGSDGSGKYRLPPYKGSAMDSMNNIAADEICKAFGIVEDGGIDPYGPDFWAKHDKAKHHGHFDPEN